MKNFECLHFLKFLFISITLLLSQLFIFSFTKQAGPKVSPPKHQALSFSVVKFGRTVWHGLLDFDGLKY